MSEWVTVRTFENSLEANIIKGLLESESIPTYLVGEHFLSSQQLFNMHLADIRLQVPAQFFSSANQVLIDYQHGFFEEPLTHENGLITNTCKCCGNLDVIEKTSFGALVIVAFALWFSGKVIPAKKHRVCSQCKQKIFDVDTH